jgi:hypothetical protein
MVESSDYDMFGREKKEREKRLPKRGLRGFQKTTPTREKVSRKLKKTFGIEGSRVGKSQQNILRVG